MMLPNGKTARKTRELDKSRLEEIRKHVLVHVFWECQIDKWLKKDPVMKKKFANYEDEGLNYAFSLLFFHFFHFLGPISLSESFFGGRTAPSCAFYKPKAGERISYFDCNSLYPNVNFKFPYPIKHPTVHVLNQTVNWTCPNDNPYKMAVLKVKIIPARNSKLPCLPLKLENDSRLLFSTCKTCCKKFPEGGVMKNYSCKHTDEQRSFIGTYCGYELNLGIFCLNE